MIKISCALFLIFISSSSFGQNTQSASQPSPPKPTISIEEATLKLKNLLAEHVTTLDRPLVTFHYESGPNPPGSGQWEFNPKTQDEVVQHILPNTKRFYDLHDGSDTEGPGVYVSSDPKGARSFGGSNPKLFVITLKAGSTILDIRSDEFFRETRGKNLLIEMGCTAGALPIYFSFGDFRNSQSLLCRQATIDALKLLNIQAILYDYSSVNSLEGCRPSRNESLNIISPDTIDVGTLAFYSNDMKIENNQLGIYTAALFNEGLLDYEHRIGTDVAEDLPPLSLTGLPSPNPSKYRRWKEKYIFKCGKPRPSEVLNKDFLQEMTRRSFTDKDLFKLQLKISRVLKERNLYFSFASNKAISLKRYAFSHMADDRSKFSQWRDGTSAANGHGQKYEGMNMAQRISISADFFEEVSTLSINNLTDLEVSQKVYGEVFQKASTDLYTKNIGLIVSTYLKYGFSKRVVTALLDSQMMWMGGTPFLTGELPTDPNVDYSDLMERNKQEAIAILNHCLSIYQNPKISSQDIQNGDCATNDN